jgi:hypothetical protein
MTALPPSTGQDITTPIAPENAHGRRKVAEILKQLENGEARKRKNGEYAYDVNRLRTELGHQSMIPSPPGATIHSKNCTRGV